MYIMHTRFPHMKGIDPLSLIYLSSYIKGDRSREAKLFLSFLDLHNYNVRCYAITLYLYKT